MTSIMSDLTSRLIEFIRDGLFGGKKEVVLHEPTFAGRERDYVVDAIDSTFVSSVGLYVDRFEEMLARFTGAARAVATCNGTAALHAALYLAGVRHGDLVVTQPLTFVATSNAILHAGAQPVFVDVEEDTLGLSPEATRRFLEGQCARKPGGEVFHKSSGRRVAACLPMHTFGFPMRVAELAVVCREWGVPLVEDSAESLGSYVGDRHTGLFGTLGILSFNGNKTITTGGGGAILTTDAALGARAKHITTTAKKPHKWEYMHDEAAFNYRLPNLNAALGCAQMERLEDKLKAKRELAEAYGRYFDNGEWKDAGYTFIRERSGTRANYWLNAVRCPDRKLRDDLLERSNAAGVMTRAVWELMYRNPAFKDCPRMECPAAERLFDTVVNLPSSPGV